MTSQKTSQKQIWSCVEDNGLLITYDPYSNRREPFVVNVGMSCLGWYKTLKQAKIVARREAYVPKGSRLNWLTDDQEISNDG